VDAVFATVASLEDAGEALTRVSQWLRIGEDTEVPVRVTASVREIHAAKAAGDTAVVLHFQGSGPLRAGADLVGAFARLGHPAGHRLARQRPSGLPASAQSPG
jgi:membrane dipeptidase